MKIALVACIHGDELYGLEILKKFPGKIDCFLGNPGAVEKKVRFIDSDLNRSFPGKVNGNKEQKRAFELTEKLKDYDFVIDLHSSSNKCPLFGIITKPNLAKIKFAKELGLKRIIIMSENYGGKALIDFCKCGISLEVGPHEDKSIINEVLEKIEKFLQGGQTEDIEIFEVFDAIKQKHKNIRINNFEFVKKGRILSEDESGVQISKEEFTAVLVDEKAYNGVLCLATRKLTNFINNSSLIDIS